MLETGIRIGETIALHVADVDLDAGLATIRRGEGGPGRVIPMPRQRRSRRCVGVVCIEPCGVEREELPDELIVSMPQGRHDGRLETVCVSKPVDPGVQVKPLALGFLGCKQVPV